MNHIEKGESKNVFHILLLVMSLCLTEKVWDMSDKQGAIYNYLKQIKMLFVMGREFAVLIVV